MLLSLVAINLAKCLTQKMTEQTTNNFPEKITVMEEASTNSLPSKRTKHHSDDNIEHPTTTSNNLDANDNNLKGSDHLLK